MGQTSGDNFQKILINNKIRSNINPALSNSKYGSYLNGAAFLVPDGNMSSTASATTTTGTTTPTTETTTPPTTQTSSGITLWDGSNFTGSYYTGEDGSQWGYADSNNLNVLYNLATGKTWQQTMTENAESGVSNWMTGKDLTFDEGTGQWSLSDISGPSSDSGSAGGITASENSTGGYGDYLSNYIPTYSDWLSGDGKEIAKAYDEASRQAETDYALNRATYGVRAEQLGRSGLTGSGYGDYLEGKAYAAMAGAKSQAEVAKADSYADYLTKQQESATSYAAYLAQQEEEKAAGKESAILSLIDTVTKSASDLTDEEIRLLAPGIELDDSDIARIRSSVELNKKMRGVDAPVDKATAIKGIIDNIISNAESGTTVTVEHLRAKAEEDGVTLDDADIEQIKNTLGGLGVSVMTQNEIKESTIASAVTAALTSDGNEDGAVDISNIQEYDTWAKIQGMTGEDYQKGLDTVTAFFYDQMVRGVQNAIGFGTPTADEQANGVGELFTPEQINWQVGKTITQAQANELIAMTQKKAAELLNQAYTTYMSGENDAKVVQILGIDSATWTNMTEGERETEIFRSACAMYDDGTLTTEDLDAFTRQVVDNRMAADDFDVTGLGQLAIELKNELPSEVWESCKKKLAEVIEFGKESSASEFSDFTRKLIINGKNSGYQLQLGYTSEDEMSHIGGVESQVKSIGETVYICNGKKGNSYSWKQIIGVGYEWGGKKDICKALFDLILSKYEQGQAVVRQGASTEAAREEKFQMKKGNYASYLTQ